MSARAPARLGRGLAALIGGPPLPGAGGGVQSLVLEQLSPGPFQPRRPIDEARVAELAASIRAHGVLQPLLVRPHPATAGQFQIIAGERRWHAAKIAGLAEVPALVRNLTDAEAMAAALVENLQRQDLNAIEEAEGYRRLIDEFRMTQDALGEAVGKSRSHIANTLRLLALPPAVQEDVRQGVISPGHARALLAHPDPERAARLVIARGLNVRQTEALVRRGLEKPPEPVPRRSRDANVEDLVRKLTDRLGTKVDLAFDGRRGSLKLYYESLEQLDGLLALLMRD